MAKNTLQMELDPDFDKWQKDPTPDNMGTIIKKYTGLLNSELPKYNSGNLPQDVLKGYGKKFIMDAVKTYKPEKGSLKNHIVLNLQRLHRVNYENSSIYRMSEELQRNANTYKTVKESLEDKLGRPATTEEMAEELKWSPSMVKRIGKQAKKEILGSSLEFAPAAVGMEDPRIDYVYHDLSPSDKLIFQHRTGYNGADLLGVTELAKMLKTSPATISNRAMAIAKSVKELLQQRYTE